MRFARLVRPAIAGSLLVLGAASPAVVAGQAAAPGVLAQVQLGQWLLKGADGAERKLCLTQRTALLQLEHSDVPCSQVVIDGTDNSTTVRYSCPGHGQGRTTLRVETRQLISIETQGVKDGAPFTAQYEGRRIGACR